MSEARGFILFANPQGWSIALIHAGQEHIDAIEGSAGSSPEVAAKLTGDVLRSLNCRAKKVVVALPDDACLCASINTDGLSRRGTQRAWLYRLEEKIPMPIEDAVVQFLPHGKRALGIGGRRQVIEPILQALETENFKIVAACPSAFLAFQGIQITRGKSMLDGTDAVLWQDDDHLHLFSKDQSQITGWLALPAEADDAMLGLASLLLARGEQLRVACIGVEAHIIQSMEGLPEIAVIAHDKISALTSTLAAASAVLAGSASPLVDLHQSGGSSPPFALPQARVACLSAAVAAMLLIACAIGALLYRASLYSDAARQAQSEKEAVFHKLFPNQAVPVSVESRLQSMAQEFQAQGEQCGKCGRCAGYRRVAARSVEASACGGSLYRFGTRSGRQSPFHSRRGAFACRR